MDLEVFTEAWVERCAEAIRHSPTYRESAASWEVDLVFVMKRNPPEAHRAVYFDLWRGECRGARLATEADRASARYVIEGSEETWEQALNGRLAPLLAVMTGRLRTHPGQPGRPGALRPRGARTWWRRSSGVGSRES